MATPTEILRKTEGSRFEEIVAASPKKFREELFRRAGIRNRGGAFTLTAGKKNEARIKRLREAILGGLELEDELVEELIRNYLYNRRELLGEALDFFEVEHDGGLTDAELDFMSELPEDKAKHLYDVLCRNHAREDVDLYFAFMNIPPPS